MNNQAVFGPGGILSRKLKGYEERPGQLQMADEVTHNLANNEVALIEAGTGTGKSLAYLVPAVLAAVNEQRRTVISTHTINLQQQLIDKDIPFVLNALDADISAILVKGMNNYACMRKADDAMAEKATLKAEEADQVDEISDWLQETQDGTRADLSFYPIRTVWERIGADFDACSHRHCPHYNNCHFFKARSKAEDAQILVVNHHILLADLLLKEEANGDEDAGILPPYDALVIDEAHHLEDVATAVWASEVSRGELVRHLGRLAADKRSVREGGKLALLTRRVREQTQSFEPEREALLNRIELQLPSEKRRLVREVNETFHRLLLFLRTLDIQEGQDCKLRLLSEHVNHEQWQAEVAPTASELATQLHRFVVDLKSLDDTLKSLDLREKCRSVLVDINATASRLQHLATLLNEFATGELTPTTVKWIESTHRGAFANLKLVSASLNIAELLVERLFNKVPAIILTSATLTTAGTFQFVRERLGIDQLQDRDIHQAIHPSPFAFADQAQLLIPRDIPPPNHPAFLSQASDLIHTAALASGGGLFILFTSFSMLLRCHQQLQGPLEAAGLEVLRQGESSRHHLLERFRSNGNAILFGTDSFWEGVDVAGTALRGVVIAKLPFPVPSEPLVQAHTEAIAAAGGNPFMDYAVPQAIVKFKQGIGRLIRHHEDYGCLLCLDSRLLTRPYGRAFLSSIPTCSQLFDNQEVVKQGLHAFYQQRLSPAG